MRAGADCQRLRRIAPRSSRARSLPEDPLHDATPVFEVFMKSFPRSLVFRILLLCCFALYAFGVPSASTAAEPAENALDFVTIRLGHGERAVLVVGGIQGDEPGGFSAATLVGTRYEIQEGAVWVVPNLNFPSIIRRSRGLHGDMNRKFAKLPESDPQYDTVRRIQELIRHPQVGLVLNLHDGSGYYRPRRESALCNPRRWGQSIVIDQECLEPHIFMYQLGQEAASVAETVNGQLMAPLHRYHVHNTRTAEGDREMEKSLSYYAVRHGKAAFGLEASKEFGVALRAYYHLLMIESFLQQAGIRFSRDFELSPSGVEKALRENLGVAFAGNRVFLPLEDVRPFLNMVPLPRDAARTAVTSKPIMAVLPHDDDRRLCVHYGNRLLTSITPEWREMDASIDGVEIVLDGERRMAGFGQVLHVHSSLEVRPREGYRVNAIGYDSGKDDESGLPLKRSVFVERFSVDKRGRVYRVEVYRGERFCGMFLIRFDD